MGKTSLLPARPRPSSRIRLVCASWLGDCSLPLKSSCVSSGATKRLCLRAVVQRSRSKTRCRRRAGTDSKPEPHVPRPPLFRRRQLSTLSLGAFPARAGRGASRAGAQAVVPRPQSSRGAACWAAGQPRAQAEACHPAAGSRARGARKAPGSCAPLLYACPCEGKGAIWLNLTACFCRSLARPASASARS